LKPAVNSSLTNTRTKTGAETWTKAPETAAVGARTLVRALRLPSYVWLGMVILAMAALSVTSLVRGREAARTAQASLEMRRQQFEAVKATNGRRRADVQNLKHHPQAAEREARQKLNYVAANEIVIVAR
jgi:cell division protein FtsB